MDATVWEEVHDIKGEAISEVEKKRLIVADEVS